MEKPGRDPRPAFKVARLADGVETIGDLKVGMVLEGTVSNVAAFGAFVDLGVHQDGLVHVSQLSNSFVTDPHAVVRTGDIVKVQVLELDVPRKRISLSMRIGATTANPNSGRTRPASVGGRTADKARAGAAAPAAQSTAMFSAFAKLKTLSD